MSLRKASEACPEYWCTAPDNGRVHAHAPVYVLGCTGLRARTCRAVRVSYNAITVARVGRGRLRVPARARALMPKAAGAAAKRCYEFCRAPRAFG